MAVTTHGTESVTFWPTGRPFLNVIEGYAAARRPITFSPDGRWLATGWSDGKLHLWPVSLNGTGEARIFDATRPPDCIAALAFDPRGGSVFAATTAGDVTVYPLTGGNPRRLDGFDSGTLLETVAASPTGHRVATAFQFGKGPRVLRVWNLESGDARSFPLPGGVEASSPDTASPNSGYAGGVHRVAFASDDVVYTAGQAGILRWQLEKGTYDVVAANPADAMTVADFGAGGRRALTIDRQLVNWDQCATVTLRDLERSTARLLTEFGDCVRSYSVDPSGSIVVTGDVDGVIRVGRAGSGEPHELLGHNGPVFSVGQSPDGRWIASAGEDNTLRLWPMPDLSRPPLHTLPHDALVAKLKSLTNLRAVRDQASEARWTIDVGPFPGWKTVPTW